MEKSFYEQMAEQEGVTELLKADRQMEWVGFCYRLKGINGPEVDNNIFIGDGDAGLPKPSSWLKC